MRTAWREQHRKAGKIPQRGDYQAVGQRRSLRGQVNHDRFVSTNFRPGALVKILIRGLFSIFSAMKLRTVVVAE